MSDSDFGTFLIAEGRLRPEGLEKALEMQAMVGGRLGTNLLERGLISEDGLLAALGRYRKTRTVSGADLRNVAPQVIKLMPRKLAQRYQIVPFQLKGRTLLIASMDPGDALVEDEVGLLTSCLARTVVGLELRILGALEAHYQIKQPTRFCALSRRLDRPGGVSPAGVGPPARIPTPADELPTRIMRRPDLPPAVPATVPTPADELATKIIRRPDIPPALRAEPPSPPAPARVAPSPPGKAAEPAAPQFIELDEEDRALLGAKTDEPKTAEERLEEAARDLQKIDLRDEIGDVLLRFCAQYFRRRLLLIHRKDQIVGWRGEGKEVMAEGVRAIDIPLNQPSVFVGLTEGTSFWLGPMPPVPANQQVVLALGGQAPRECVVLPIVLRSRVVAYLYGDNGEAGVTGAPMSELRRLVGKAGVAFEVYILKNKIRRL